MHRNLRRDKPHITTRRGVWAVISAYGPTIYECKSFEDACMIARFIRTGVDD